MSFQFETDLVTSDVTNNMKRGKKKKKKRNDLDDSTLGLRIRSNVPTDKFNIMSGI